MNKKDAGSSRAELRSGYTTGSCAAAAARAAALLLEKGEKPAEVSITLPGGDTLNLPVDDVCWQQQAARAVVTKDAGDDPDVTDRLQVIARVARSDGGIEILGGRGIGVVTKPGLSVPVGEPAINPVPRSMIIREVSRVLGPGAGARVTIEAPGGELLAEKTLNPRLGIKGGISVLGTTGIVHPMSDDAYIRSLVPQIDQARALGYRHAVLTPGRMGENMAISLGFPAGAVIQTSNYIGDLLEESARKGLHGVILLGHLGKLLKVAAGIFLTHSRQADARRETLAAHAAMLGAGQDLVKQVMELNTAEEAVPLLRANGLDGVFSAAASAASSRASQFCGGEIEVGTIMYSFSGGVLGMDRKAREIGGKLGWQAK